MGKQISSIKQDPEFYVEKSFERIFNELDLRKEILKKEFEHKLDEYYTEKRNDLVKLKEKIIQDLKSSLAESHKKLIVNSINPNVSSCTKVKEKLELIELELKKLLDKKKKVKKIIWKSEFGESLKLCHENDQIQMKNLFGKIDNNLFDFEEVFVLNDDLKNILSIKQIDEIIMSGSYNITRHFIGHTGTFSRLCIINNEQFASCSEDIQKNIEFNK